MKIIGLAGTAGSGKDTVAEMICVLLKAHHWNTSDFVRSVTRHVFGVSQDTPIIRDQLYAVANELRALNQATTVQMGIMQARERSFDVQLITGLRSVGEADAVRAAGGIIVGVDASPQVRHERIQSRVRDAESQRDFEAFLKQDTLENKGIGDGPQRGIRSIIDSADILVVNDGTLDELKDQVAAKIKP